MALASLFKPFHVPKAPLSSSSTLLQRRHYVDVSRAERDMNQNFSEIVSASPPPPDRINRFMDSITAAAPSTASSYALSFRMFHQPWSVKALLLRGKPNLRQKKRTVIIASGFRAHERGTISVNLHIAAVLAHTPLLGADVTVFPLLNSKDYFHHFWKKDEMAGRPLIPIKNEDNPKDVSERILLGILQHHMNYVAVTIDMNQNNSLLRHKGNKFLNTFTDPSSPTPPLQSPPWIDILREPPAIVIELRDKDGMLGEEHIIRRGWEVIAAIQQLMKDTELTTGM